METAEQLMCLNSGEENFQRITGTASPGASIPFSSWNLGMSVQKESEADSVSETSNYSEDIGIIEGNSMQNIHEGESGESPPRETASLFSAAMGSNTDHNTENEELGPTHDEFVVPSNQEDREREKPLEDALETEEKTREHLGDDCDQEEPMEEEDEKRAAKRPRLSIRDEVEEMEK